MGGLLGHLDRWLAPKSPLGIVTVALLLVSVIGTVDYALGYELSFSIFYVLPVAITVWYAGKRKGLWFCALAATIWLSADYFSGHIYSEPAIRYWNAGVRFGFFLIITLLLDRLRVALENQRALAETDNLTGMLNIRAFRQGCLPLFDLAARHRQTMAVAYLDLDGFKSVNDSMGHAVGDQVLQAVAATLRKRLRLSDLACRMGGDEFAIVLPQTDLAGAQAFFGALHQSLVDMAAAGGWPVGFSIGVALVRGSTCDYASAIKHADELMYRVKRSGKNTLQYAEFPHCEPST